MKQIKNVLYAALTIALVTAPSVVGAQWSAGRTNAQSSGLPTDSISGIITRTMDWLLAMVGFLGVIGFVIAGILYLTAAGDEDQIGKAKNAMVYSIIGVIVALIGFVVINAVEGWLSASNTSF